MDKKQNPIKELLNEACDYMKRVSSEEPVYFVKAVEKLTAALFEFVKQDVDLSEISTAANETSSVTPKLVENFSIETKDGKPACATEYMKSVHSGENAEDFVRVEDQFKTSAEAFLNSPVSVGPNFLLSTPELRSVFSSFSSAASDVESENLKKAIELKYQALVLYRTKNQTGLAALVLELQDLERSIGRGVGGKNSSKFKKEYDKIAGVIFKAALLQEETNTTDTNATECIEGLTPSDMFQLLYGIKHGELAGELNADFGSLDLHDFKKEYAFVHARGRRVSSKTAVTDLKVQYPISQERSGRNFFRAINSRKDEFLSQLEK